MSRCEWLVRGLASCSSNIYTSVDHILCPGVIVKKCI